MSGLLIKYRDTLGQEGNKKRILDEARVHAEEASKTDESHQHVSDIKEIAAQYIEQIKKMQTQKPHVRFAHSIFSDRSRGERHASSQAGPSSEEEAPPTPLHRRQQTPGPSGPRKH